MAHPTKFVILGSQRTGTTLVRTSLSSHPGILCVGEAFNLGKRPYKEAGGYWHFARRGIVERLLSLASPRQCTNRYLDQLFASDQYEAIGFKLMLNHCQLRPFLWPILKDHGIKALLVTRRNVLKTLLSRLTAAKSGVYHVSESLGQRTAVKSWKASSVQVDTSTLIEKLEAIESEREQWLSMLNDDVPCMEIVYEDYVSDIDSANQSILSFLGVEGKSLHSDLKKVNPDSLQDIIENYQDVASALAGSRHREHLTS